MNEFGTWMEGARKHHDAAAPRCCCLEELSNDLRPPKLAHNALGPSATWWEQAKQNKHSHARSFFSSLRKFSRVINFSSKRARQRRLHAEGKNDSRFEAASCRFRRLINQLREGKKFRRLEVVCLVAPFGKGGFWHGCGTPGWPKNGACSNGCYRRCVRDSLGW